MTHHHNGPIHPTALIGDAVDIAPDVSVGPFAVILGPTTIGPRASIGAGALIGGPPEIASLPQRRGWLGEEGYSGVVIGADVVVREHVVIHQGSHRPTMVGDGTWVLNSAYLAHDVQVGSRVTVSAGVAIGGHVSVGDAANIGMNATIHQRRVIGAGAMIGMSTPVTRDVPPFAKVFGTPPRLKGVNRVALERVGASADLIEALGRAYDEGVEVGELVSDPVAADVRPMLEWWLELAGRPLTTPRPEAAHG
jgi:UDP-N-acetylglucosamine acyltransferase